MPLIDDTIADLNIGDRMTDAQVSWAWYSGGWDNAAGNVGGPATRMAPPDLHRPQSTPALRPPATGGYPYCPDLVVPVPPPAVQLLHPLRRARRIGPPI